MTKPSIIPLRGKVQGQRPAPPGASATFLADAESEFDLQRENLDSTHFNTLVCTARAVADWVMEPEVPKPAADEFLQWPTRRAFVNDKIQIRIQIDGHVLPTSAFVEIAVKRGPDPLLVITTDPPPPPPPPGTVGSKPKVHRKLRQAPKAAGEMLESETETDIFLEQDGGHHRSFLFTTIELPEHPSPGSYLHEIEVYEASVHIVDRSVMYSVQTPPIEVVRWWAQPSVNIDALRTRADSIEPLIDGENFFREVVALLAAAAAGHSVFLASWSFMPLTCIENGPGAPDTAALQPNLKDALKDMLAGHIRAAAARGAKIYILLDALNGGWAAPIIEFVVKDFLPGEGANIYVRISKHPTQIFKGLGRFVQVRQYGSYHEKYLCLTGNGSWKCLIGGIDVSSDRFSPFQHKWRTNYKSYLQVINNHYLVQAITFNAYFHKAGTTLQYQATPVTIVDRFDPTVITPGPPPQHGRVDLLLWHDIGVHIKGQEAVQYLADDFVRRWNAGEETEVPPVFPRSTPTPTPSLPAIPYTAPPISGTFCQFIKTDLVENTPPIGRSIPEKRHTGTRDVWEIAIREARHYIYIENQYVRDPHLRDLICECLRNNTKLQVILVVPFQSEEEIRQQADDPDAPKHVDPMYLDEQLLLRLFLAPAALEKDMTHRIRELHGSYLSHEFIMNVKKTAPDRVGVFTLARKLGARPEMIYPHSKIMIIDDTWAYIGSANANGRSLYRDAESGYVIHDRAIVTAFRRKLWEEHLGKDLATRDIREFLKEYWDKDAAAECDYAELLTDPKLGPVQAVHLGEPPKGQRYNGPLSLIDAADMEA